MDLIIYHQNCPDGWCAAFIASMKYPGAELLPLNHGLNEKQLREVFAKAEGKDVLVVDYSLRTRELNDELFRISHSLQILDHHKSAREVLEGATYATFDMKRSGAGLAWDYLFGADSDYHKTISVYNPTGDENMPPMKRPWWVNYTEDQDLWNWALSRSQEINAYLMVQSKTKESWMKMLAFFNGIDDVVDQVAKLGSGIRQYIEYYTKNVVADLQEGVFVFEGRNYRTAVLNIPYSGVSEAGNAVCKAGYDIGLAWFERGDGVIQFSLRSNKEGSNVDVSAIAKTYGGGGHQNAAGFQVSVKEGREIVDWILGRNTYVPTATCCR